ncbi:MAG: BREX system P-loop protein BrxC, partial [Chloroflexota bacterium]|nr:BREX system P-loop protein BrxC [Chloroflexota bacterium]
MTSTVGTMLNREVFAKDPLATEIPNLGVVKVTEPSSDQEWAVLRYELSTFVCEGEYQRGLERILNAYLGNLGQPAQPAVWVSGFFGSGKSHLVRVLEYLWRDTRLPDGATARGLVTLPPEIDAQLRELSTVGRREGGLWSAAGTLSASAGDSIGLALLAIVFRSADLPESYPAARFALWLRQNALYDAVRGGVAAQGRDFAQELRNMYVSPVLARALLDAMPGFAADQRGARDLLKAQFPNVADISDGEMVATLEEVLRLQSADGARLPCALLVLDELQQFIGDNAERSLRVQQTIEACSGRFGSRLLVVATGQSAMQGTPLLARIAGRFAVQVALSDTDVTQVVRQVVLRKRPDREAPLVRTLATVSGEIDRQLRGTKIEPTGADAKA